MIVTVYTSAGCEPCELVKAALIEAGIEFSERSVTEPGVWGEVERYLPDGAGRAVPVTVISTAESESVLRGWYSGFIDFVRAATDSAGHTDTDADVRGTP